ncbi:MAG: T9SS type A sorting domain-containing protein [Sphingobacteriales bacterium JAD_PAG50586_3]|nr:MAG: T9SS type A sorting domain-containing protein [Sphingobacteriales bacterium JAD_PAG50586_3]
MKSVKIIYIFDTMQPTPILKAIFTLTALILCGLIKAQIINYAHGPEQDCVNAIHISANGQFYYDMPYEGYGSVSEVNPKNSCLTYADENSVWFKVCIANPGELNFCIQPEDGNADYNYAVYNLTTASCSDIYNNSTLEVSCNSSNGTFPSNCTGPSGGAYPMEEPTIQVDAGDIYYILVSRHDGSNTPDGFYIYCIYTPTGIISNIDCNAPLSVNNNSIASLTLYPNPAGNTLTLYLPAIKQGQSAGIIIYNSSGAMVKQVADISQPKTLLDVANLPTGLYYYIINTCNGQHSGRFLKN